MKRKGQYSRIAFCVKNNLVLHPFISYNTVQDISSKNTRALICFSSTIDENTDNVHLIEGFVF